MRNCHARTRRLRIEWVPNPEGTWIAIAMPVQTFPLLTPHSATFSSAGSLCRWLLALRRIRSGEEFLVSLEALDDVVFEPQGKPPDLFQLKHHVRRAANLTDASSDLWKTLRIRCEATTGGMITPLASFYLVTTSMSGEGSAAGYLRSDSRDVPKAAERLRSTAQVSSNQTNKLGYEAFLKLSPEAQLQLLSRVFVLDTSPNILDLDTELQKEVRWAVDRKFIVPFLHRLEGWWLHEQSDSWRTEIPNRS